MGKTRILVVEDEAIIAMTLRNRLLGLGYDVPPTVFTGQEALEKAAELRPDLVLMDIRLRGDMDGIAAADQVRARFDIPVIYLTAYADKETLARAKVTEPYGYILKPYQERELHTAIEIALYKHRVQQEREELAARLRQAEKLEAVAMLAAGVAHHFNNLMAVVVGYASLLRDGPIEQDELPGHLETIQAAGERAAALTRQLLAFSRQHMLRPEVHDLNTTVKSLHEVLLRSLDAGIEVEITAAAEPALATYDQGQIEQVLVNLAQNARSAMPRGGHFHLQVARVTLDEAQARAHSEERPGHFVRLLVTDTGAGINAQTLPRIFEPFFSTDPEQAGLGLSVAYGIVKQHGGWIDVHSAPGQGTTLGVYLPASPGQ